MKRKRGSKSRSNKQSGALRTRNDEDIKNLSIVTRSAEATNRVGRRVISKAAIMQKVRVFF